MSDSIIGDTFAFQVQVQGKTCSLTELFSSVLLKTYSNFINQCLQNTSYILFSFFFFTIVLFVNSVSVNSVVKYSSLVTEFGGSNRINNFKLFSPNCTC